MNKYLFLSMALSSILLVSCNNSKSAIDDLEDVVEKVESSSELTENDLEDIMNEYTEVEKKLQKYEYTDEELKEIGRLKGKYAAKMTKAAMKEFKNKMDNFGKQLEGGMEGFMEEMDKE